MRLGLGSGSTAAHFVRLLGERVARRAATSSASRPPTAPAGDRPQCRRAADHARRHARTRPRRRRRRRDRARSCADQGRRRRAAAREDRRQCLAAHDRDRRCRQSRWPSSAPFPLPIEVVAFGLAATALAVERAAERARADAAASTSARHGGEPFVTDGGNRILDASFGRIPDPEALAGRLAGIPESWSMGSSWALPIFALVASPDGRRRRSRLITDWTSKATLSRSTEVEMKASLAALRRSWWRLPGLRPGPRRRTRRRRNAARIGIMETELPPERMALAMKLVELSGTTRIFDEVPPDHRRAGEERLHPRQSADAARHHRGRRPDRRRSWSAAGRSSTSYLARVWASGFSDEEMQELIDFYSTDTGKKLSAGAAAGPRRADRRGAGMGQVGRARS